LNKKLQTINIEHGSKKQDSRETRREQNIEQGTFEIPEARLKRQQETRQFLEI